LLFICVDYITPNEVMTVNDELGRMWKEAGVFCLKIVFQNLPELAEENHENPQEWQH
jgi:hypothetical protein